MSLVLEEPEQSAEEAGSVWQDEIEYSHIKLQYANRVALMAEAMEKKKAFQEIPPGSPLYHRLQVSAEMACMRVHMAYILNENRKLTQIIGTVSWLHDQVSILQGAYAHVKMLAEMARIDYGTIAKGIAAITKLKEELTNEINKKGADGDNGAPTQERAGQESDVLPSKAP